MSTPTVSEFEQRGTSAQLVVLLHGYSASPSNLVEARQVVAEALPNADLLIPKLPTGFFSFAKPTDVVQTVLDPIDAHWNDRESEGRPYQSIILAGHSCGALIARKVYVVACGENAEAPFEEGLERQVPRPWAKQVERVILLAGMNRGWEINQHLLKWRAVLWTLFLLVGNVIMRLRRGEPLVFSIRRGATFLTDLRVQWLVMRRAHANKGVGDALTIQLLGSVDDLVSPADNLDLVSGRDFIYLDVPHSGHADVMRMDSTSKGRGRAAVFRLALTGPRQDLEQEQILPSDNPVGEPDESVTDVVFVIHGIRDEGYWTHKIARRARRMSRDLEGRNVATETTSYGFFSMLRFLIPWERRAMVEWFMDQYAEAKARYPNAEFSFIGHSHGTYLLARALETYRCCRFRNVVFAGSVVRRMYKWERFLSSGQVKAVANYVASRDWVVACFPGTFQMLHLQDLGTAGHDGFDSEQVSEVEYVRGPHSAAIQEDNWDQLATFVLEGGKATLPAPLKEKSRAWWVRVLGRIAPVVPLTLFAIPILGGVGIWLAGSRLNWYEWLTTLILVGYFWTLRWIVTRL